MSLVETNTAEYANMDVNISTREAEMSIELQEARDRIAQLEAELESFRSAADEQKANGKKRLAQLTLTEGSAIKKSKTTAIMVSPPSTKKQPSNKVMIDRMKQSIKTALKGIKFYPGCFCTERKISVQDVMEKSDFEAMFGNLGTLIQPTPDNKPKSTVTIRQISGSDMEMLLGTKEFKGEYWTKGGEYSFRRAGFSKSMKIKGGVPVIITEAEVHYGSNNGKLTLKLNMFNKEY